MDKTSADSLAFVDNGLRNLMAEVSIKEPSKVYNPTGHPRILILDCGLKNNQLRCFLARGACLQIFPWNHPILPEMENFDGLFLSNGPGDPALCLELIDNMSSYLQSPNIKPVFGICMGHQIIALAAGLKTYRLKYGNRGHNQPCKHHGTGRCYITSQNHGFAVDSVDLPHPWEVLFTNANDGTNEGIINAEKPIFSVQFHPEHIAGPTDTEWLFDVYLDSIVEFSKHGKTSIADKLTAKIQASFSPKPVSAFKPSKVLILGSGGLTIGQAGEFDYCGSQAIKALKDEGVRTVLINPNVATSQTSKGLADTVYFLPISAEYVIQVIKAERPDGILLNFGGQTALNCGVKLVEVGVLAKYNVAVLGTPVQVIIWTEDRQLFADKLAEIGYKSAPGSVAYTVEDAVAVAGKLGYPLLVRAAFSLGGLNSGFANNQRELIDIARKALTVSSQLFIDKSLKGWKEVEYEVVRDVFDNCITVCNMENIDPLGIHTGDSFVIAPSQTLSNSEFHVLRTAAIKVIRHLGVVGECNIQFALDPNSENFFVVEVNARLSRSSALASKATGYPLAFIAAKLAMGHSLVELRNPVTQVTSACFEPSLDYCVVKVPRWDLKKFPGVSPKIGSAMKSIGEVMAIGRSFEEAFQKALRMVNEDYLGFDPYLVEFSEDELIHPSEGQYHVLATALAEGITVDYLHKLTKIDRWFLAKMKKINDFRVELSQNKSNTDGCCLNYEIMLTAKKLGFCDRQIAACLQTTKEIIRAHRHELRIHPWVKQIDTVAGEWPAMANYLYTTYHSDQHDVIFNQNAEERPAIMVLGSGVYRIGSSVEFDCCAVGCLAELRRLGRKTIMLNCNPETVSTDYDVCDRLYFEEISVECVMDIYELENPEGLILSMGGQLPNNIAVLLHHVGAVILGTSPESIDSAENRFKFSRLLDTVGVEQPKWQELTSLDAARNFCSLVGYPCLIRPSYVLSGASMQIAYSIRDLEVYLSRDAEISRDYPVVISKFIENAREIDVDAVAADGAVVCLAISEHVEYAGVHSGDAILITPPQDLDDDTIERIREITVIVADLLDTNGPLNLQLLLKNTNLQVIECNLRVSRSFPFVSKTLDYDFVVAATRIALGEKVDPAELIKGNRKRVGVKAPMFSFARLPRADVALGVEMRSTGEVAGYGSDKYEAFLKAIISTGFKYPKPGGNIFIGISSVRHREELTASLIALGSLGFKLFGNPGTAEYYNNLGITMEEVEWTADAAQICRENNFHLAISIPTLKGSTPRLSIDSTMGHKVSRTAADFDIPLVTNMSYAKILIEALCRFPQPPPLRLDFDCATSRTFIRLPGLIDVHTCVPGAARQEDISSATSAAIFGGITMICCTTITEPQITNENQLSAMQTAGKLGACCDFGFFLDGSIDNSEEVSKLAGQSLALKLHINRNQVLPLQLDNMTLWDHHFHLWPKHRPICIQAENKSLAALMLFAHLYDRSVHVCNVSTREEISLVRDAKRKGLKLTCEITPHHLFWTEDDLKLLQREKVPFLISQDDQQALWDNMEQIDCFVSGKYCHWLTEQETPTEPSASKCFGLETMLPLLLTAVHDGRLTLEDITKRMYDNPRKIFGLPEQDTFIEVDLEEEWTIKGKSSFVCKVMWKQFAGRKVRGKVHRVVLRGEDVNIDGHVTAEPGSGLDIKCPLHQIVSDTKFASKFHRSASELAATSASDEFPLPCSLRPRLVSECTPTYGPQLLEPQPPRPEVTIRSTTFISGKQLPRTLSTFDLCLEKVKEEVNAVVFNKAKKSKSYTSGELNFMRTEFRRQSVEPNSPNAPYLVALPFRHVINVEDFEEQHLDYLFNLAKYFQSGARKGRVTGSLLAGRVVAILFYDQSDKTTMNSYATAMQRLGGSVIYMDPTTSSVQKGESIRDTITIMASYCDAVILKQSQADPMETATWCGLKPLINAGDASGEDVTQAISDAFTIWDEIGTLQNLIVTFVGNLAKGSPVHGLIKLLALYGKRMTMRFVVSNNVTSLPENIHKFLADHGVVNVSLHASLDEALPDTNILYMGSIDCGDFVSQEDYDQALKEIRLTPKSLMQLGRCERRGAKSVFRVLHPLPRSPVIAAELDSDPRAVYFRQAENGLYIRMALLASLIRSSAGERKGSFPPSEVSIHTFRKRRNSTLPL